MAAPAGAAFDLASAPTAPLVGELVRAVAFAALVRRQPPEFLYASGKPNRFNPSGVECVYFADDERTAREEYVAGFGGLASVRQPRTIFFARVRLARVLDLTDLATLEHVGLDEAERDAPWRTADSPTRAQLLGEAVSRQSKVSAIRYPSVAAAAAGVAGANVVIFRASLAPGDLVEVLGPDREPLDAWGGRGTKGMKRGR